MIKIMAIMNEYETNDNNLTMRCDNTSSENNTAYNKTYIIINTTMLSNTRTNIHNVDIQTLCVANSTYSI
ncbi:MAG: hypothetical protein NVSMB46_01940 [Candidatus Saccharimonadales bacterium]